MPDPSVLEIPDNGGPVAVLADLHLKSYVWVGSNPFKSHGQEDRLFQPDLDALIITGGVSDTLGPSLQPLNEPWEQHDIHPALERDYAYALRCYGTYTPVLLDKLSPETCAILRHELTGRASPIVPQEDAFYAADVMLALGRRLAGSRGCRLRRSSRSRECWSA